MAVFQKREGIMLAYPAEEKRIQNFPLFTNEDETLERKMFHQPKLNGERARVEWFGREPYLFSSYGNEFKFLDRIRHEIIVLSKELGREFLHDGEIYVHGWSRERIDSALRRTKNRNPDTDSLEYHIFDNQATQEQTPQYQRFAELGTINTAIQDLRLSALKVVEFGITSDVGWLGQCGTYVAQGYEGIILRNPLGLYVERRSPDILKFKPTETDTYIIAAVNEANTSDTNEPKGMVGSFTVYATDEPGSSTFDVGAGKLPHDKRIMYWNNKESCIGMPLLVKHELLKTTNQVPIAAVTVDIVW